jgi:hypothetical protein
VRELQENTIRKCSLLNFVGYNIGKIKLFIEKITGDYKNGFREGRSVIDRYLH